MKDKIQMFGKKWIESVIFGLVFGGVYFVILKIRNLGSIQIDLNLLGVALATAVTEELVFSGFVAGYLERVRKGRIVNLIIVGAMTAVIRLPILLFIYQATGGEILGVLLVALASGTINAWIRVKTGNVTGSVLARLGMNLASLG